VAMRYLGRGLVALLTGAIAQGVMDRAVGNYKKANSSATAAQLDAETQKWAAVTAGGAVVLGAIGKAVQYQTRRHGAGVLDLSSDGLIDAGATILGMSGAAYLDANVLKVGDPLPSGDVAPLPPPVVPAPVPNYAPPLPLPQRLAPSTNTAWTNAV